MKKRGKKLMAFIGSVLMIGMCVIPVDAMDNKTDISNQKQMDCVFEYPVNETPILQKASSGETLEYKYADGTITQEYLDFSTLTSLYGTRSEMSIGEYLPDPYVAQTTRSTSANRGENNPVDKRIGRIRSYFDTDGNGRPDSYSYGTGSLQSYDIVISAAHCVWNLLYAEYETGGWASEIVFFAGYNRLLYADSADYVRAGISTLYKNNCSLYVAEDGTLKSSIDGNYDWSVIQIDENLGGQYGWLGLHGCSSLDIGLSVTAIGYPSDVNGRIQYYSNGEFTEIRGNIMVFDAYVTHGNSGGPVMNNGYVYGIVSFFYSDPTTNEWTISGATCMYDGLFNIIVAERAASAERWAS